MVKSLSKEQSRSSRSRRTPLRMHPRIRIAPGVSHSYIIVAIELALISAIRHPFFGSSWWLSALQVVGGEVRWSLSLR